MKVRDLVQLLQQQDPEAIVVVNDRRELVRSGLIRLLDQREVVPTLVGQVWDEDGSWVCPWKDRPEDADGPYAGVLLGPP